MITDSKPNTFGYPTQILIRSELGLQYLLNPSNDLRVIYYDYQVLNPKGGQLPSKRYIIFYLKTAPKGFIGIQFVLKAWPSYSIKIEDKIITTYLNTIRIKFSDSES